MIKIKPVFIGLFFLYSFISFSQNKPFSNSTLKIFFQKKALQFKSETNFNKAQFFFIKNNLDSTLVYAMKQIVSSNNKELTDYCHYFRASCFYNKSLYRESVKELHLITNTDEILPLKKIMLGRNALELREFKKALSYYKELIKTPQKANQLYSICQVYEGLGLSYLLIDDFKKAEYFFQKNLILRKKETDTKGIYTAYSLIANLYYIQKKNEKALEYFKKAYTIAKNIQNFETKEFAAYNLSGAEETLGNYKKALVYRRESEQWKDSLNNQNKVWAVADFEKKYAVAQKQKEIKVLEVENQLKNTQRNWLFFSAIILLVLLTAGIYLYAQKVKNSKTILLQKNKLDELNATKDQLFSIVSHDLRSSVHALKTSNSKLSATLETKNYDELNQLIIQNSDIANGAYSLLDNLLHWAMLQTKQLYFHKESVHLHSIVQQIEYNYKPLLLDKSISFENSVAKNCFIFVDLDSLKIVLRNLLDNAIKFSNENGKISFYTSENNSDFCQLVLEDNGIGMNQTTVDQLLQENELLAKKNNSEIIGTGLGMQLCKQMIKKNGGKINIESQANKGTKVILLLPKTASNG